MNSARLKMELLKTLSYRRSLPRQAVSRGPVPNFSQILGNKSKLGQATALAWRSAGAELALPIPRFTPGPAWPLWPSAGATEI